MGTVNEVAAEVLRDTTCVVVRVGGSRYCVPVEHVREVVTDASLTPVPGSPRALPGVINVRGRVVALLDLAEALRVDPGEDRSDGRPATALVLDAETAPDVALRVDEVIDVLDLAADRFQAPPAFGLRGAAGYALAVVELPSGLSVVLDVEELLAGVDPAAGSDEDSPEDAVQ